MIFRYWVEFDSEGEIEALHRSKEPNCKEYIVKLIPIDRQKEKLEEQAGKVVKGMEDAAKGSKRLSTEIEKLLKQARRFKI